MPVFRRSLYEGKSSSRDPYEKPWLLINQNIQVLTQILKFLKKTGQNKTDQFFKTVNYSYLQNVNVLFWKIFLDNQSEWMCLFGCSKVRVKESHQKWPDKPPISRIGSSNISCQNVSKFTSLYKSKERVQAFYPPRKIFSKIFFQVIEYKMSNPWKFWCLGTYIDLC